MRVIFLGTPDFAVPSLERLIQAGHEILAVYTQPDRPSGRGRQMAAPPVKQAALKHNLPVRQPERIRRPEVVAELAELRPEVMVVVGYGQIIPQPVIDIPPLGIINVHASLLPKYRGAAPVQWAIARGETETGVTTMRIDAGLDTGDILLQRATPIHPEEDAVSLAARLAGLGAELLVETLDGLRLGTIMPVKQDHAQASYAPLLRKEDGLIDWRLPALEIHNRVRGFVPWPGSHTRFRNRELLIWKSRPVGDPIEGEPGKLVVCDRRLLVCCGRNTGLELLELQLEGRKRISVGEFLSGQHVATGEMLGEDNR